MTNKPPSPDQMAQIQETARQDLAREIAAAIAEARTAPLYRGGWR